MTKRELGDEHLADAGDVVGCLLGTAVGDAIGLPYEGLTKTRAARILGPPDRHRLIGGRGMVSDDTEHSCMVLQAFIESEGNIERFRRSLGWRFRFWLLGLPAGIGFATLRAILRLWCGVPPHRSGVFSAGNGPSMRAPILGAAIDDLESLREFVRASTRLTHTDPKAEHGAFAAALAAHLSRGGQSVSPQEYLIRLESSLENPDPELMQGVKDAVRSVEREETTESFAESRGLGRGVSGYVCHTMPVVLHAWLRSPNDFVEATTSVIRCGGDADTTAAIVGGIVGTRVGKRGIPAAWMDHLCDWPRSTAWMEKLAIQGSLGPRERGRPPLLPIWGIVPRNLFFLGVILTHGLRRTLPPY